MDGNISFFSIEGRITFIISFLFSSFRHVVVEVVVVEVELKLLVIVYLWIILVT